MLFNLPWSISFGYGVTMRENTDKSKFNYHTMRYPYKFTQNLNVSGNMRSPMAEYHVRSLATTSRIGRYP